MNSPRDSRNLWFEAPKEVRYFSTTLALLPAPASAMSRVFKGVADVIGRVSTVASTSASRWSIASNAAPSNPCFPASAPISTLTHVAGSGRFLPRHPALAASIRGKHSNDQKGQSVYVGDNNDVDRALRKLKRLMIGEGVIGEMKNRKHFRKGSEKRVEAKSMREYKTQKQTLRRKLGWIMSRKDRGF
tara:strand:+ start:374 stop:937 length:564 start_codon:yes stop_codon:yes gene_type:complete